MLAINGFEYEAKDRREIKEIYRRWGVKLVSGV